MGLNKRRDRLQRVQEVKEYVSKKRAHEVVKYAVKYIDGSMDKSKVLQQKDYNLFYLTFYFS